MEKLRYTARESCAVLGIGPSKFWNLVRVGRLHVHYDGTKAYCTPETLMEYARSCLANTTRPANMPRATPGVKGVKAPA